MNNEISDDDTIYSSDEEIDAEVSDDEMYICMKEYEDGEDSLTYYSLTPEQSLAISKILGWSIENNNKENEPRESI